jgi:hypothetical protein
MNYVIAVLTDRIQAEAAYSTLEKEGLPLDQVSILGKGYKTAAEFGFIDPKEPARRQAKLMSFWLIPFGFVGGVAFNLSTHYQLLPEVGALGNQLLGGLLGAVGGAMGGFAAGMSSMMSSEDESLPYRNRLKEGKYLVVVKGASNLTNRATRILRQLEPESVQSYVDPNQV